MAENPESGGFLAVIDAKIAALQQLRESLIAAISVGALGQTSEIDPALLSGTGGIVPPGGAGTAKSGGSVELPTGIFRGQGLSDAVRLYLSMAKRKQTNQQIKGALMQGGLATTSDFFDQTLSSTLHRMRKSGELLQFPDGWDLAASYPESFRQRMTEAKEPASKKKRKKKSSQNAKSAPKTGSKAKPEAKAHVADGPALRAV